MNAVVSVASVASAAAVASPSIAEMDFDTDLVSLGRKFEPLLDQYYKLQCQFQILSSEAQTRAHVRAGISDIRKALKHEREQVLERMFALQTEIGLDEVDKLQEAVCREADELAKEIMRMPAHTLAGLRAKVLVSIYVNTHLWSEPFEDLDWDKQANRQLIEANCLLVNIAIPDEITLPEVEITEEDDAIGAESRALWRQDEPDLAKKALMQGYAEWLFHERRALMHEIFPEVSRRQSEKFGPCTIMSAYHYELPGEGEDVRIAPPSERAKRVLEAVGALPLIEEATADNVVI